MLLVTQSQPENVVLPNVYDEVPYALLQLNLHYLAFGCP
jgi:hypothetical protein